MSNSDNVWFFMIVFFMSLFIGSLAALYKSQQEDKKQFTLVCQAAGGIVVFDGRQYQCIQVKK